MKKLLFYFASVAALIAAGCSNYDDTELAGRVDDLESRVEALEKLVQSLNNDMKSVSKIVNALDDYNYITAVEPIKGDPSGWRITFVDNTYIEIFNGAKGDRGPQGDPGTAGQPGQGEKGDTYVPTITIETDDDGNLCWKVDGEWLVDEQGNHICAEGKDGEPNGEKGDKGQNGVTPKLKVEDGWWWVSYSPEGETEKWEKLGPVAEETTGGDSMFDDVTIEDGYVTFKMAENGQEFKVPLYIELSIEFEGAGEIAMHPNTTRTIPYTLKGNEESLTIDVLYAGNVKAVVDKESATTGTITIIAGETLDRYDHVGVMVANGWRSLMTGISFEAPTLTVTNGVEGTFTIAATGGDVTVNVSTNAQYTVEIPEMVQSWISEVKPQTRALREETITLKVEPNYGLERSATLAVIDSDDVKLGEFKITQEKNDKPQPIEITIPTDWNDTWVYTATANGMPVAQIAKEFLRRKDVINAQAIVVYPIDAEGCVDLGNGFVAEVTLACDNLTTTMQRTDGFPYDYTAPTGNIHGGKVSFDVNAYNTKMAEASPFGAANTSMESVAGLCDWLASYKAGTSAKLTKVYISSEGEIVGTEEANAVAATVEPYLVVDVRGDESETYGVVKVGPMYWLQSNLRTARYNAKKNFEEIPIRPNGTFNSEEIGPYVLGASKVYDQTADDANTTLAYSAPSLGSDEAKMAWGYYYTFGAIIGKSMSEYGFTKQYQSVDHNDDVLSPEGWTVPTRMEGYALVYYTCSALTLGRLEPWYETETTENDIAGMHIRKLPYFNTYRFTYSTFFALHSCTNGYAGAPTPENYTNDNNSLSPLTFQKAATAYYNTIYQNRGNRNYSYPVRCMNNGAIKVK